MAAVSPQDELTLKTRIQDRTSKYPGPKTLPFIKSPRKELVRICDWMVAQQRKDGTWLEKNSRPARTANE